MAVKNVMSHNPEVITSGTSILETAKKMKSMDCGFLPVADKNQRSLLGTVTDRDITIRGVAAGLDPNTEPVDKVLSEKVLYCFEDDNLESAATSMRDQCVYRLVVLDNEKDKNMVGIISLGDLVRHDQSGLASEASAGIASAQAA